MSKRYRVSLETALEKLTSSELFGRQLKSGRYIYAEKRICLNQPQYIRWNDTVALLTDYAWEHQDECCLTPNDSTPKVQTGKNAKDRGVVHAYGGSPYVARQRRRTVRCYRCKRCRPKREIFIRRLANTSRTVAVLAESLPNNFSQMLDKLIESKGVTEEELAESANLSVKTIQRLRNHEPKSVTLETVLQLCIGLHLHPILSEYLLRAAGQRFMDTKLHTMYKFLLYTCYEYPVETCNDLLESQGLPVLGKNKNC